MPIRKGNADRRNLIRSYLKEGKCKNTAKDRKAYYFTMQERARQAGLEDLTCFFQGMLLCVDGDYAGAVATFENSKELNSRLAYPWHGLGNVYSGLKEYERAQEAYRKAIELDPAYAYPWIGLGNVYFNLKQYERAQEAYRKAIELDPAGAYPWNGLGTVYFSLKEYEKAQDAYLKAIELDPAYASPRNWLGNVYSDLKEYEKAQAAYRKSIELDPASAHPWNGLGNVYRGLKKYEKAEEAYRKSIELDPAFAYPWNGLGNVYSGLKEYEKAQAAYRKAIELDPASAHPWNGLGTVYSDLKEYEKAEGAYRKSIELDPAYAPPWHGLGAVYSVLKEYEKAEDAYRKSIELDPAYAPPWYGLGCVYSDLKEYEKAREAFRKSIELDPSFVYPWNGLGTVYCNLKEYEKAQEAFRKTIELNEEFVAAYYNMGLLYRDINRLDEAKEAFQRAAQLYEPEQDEYYGSLIRNHLKDLEERIAARHALHEPKAPEGSEDATILAKILNKTESFAEEVYDNQKRFENFVKQSPLQVTDSIYLKVLRRWNSYTPIIADNHYSSKGGGYFLKVNGRGIVIDPGFNFIDNFKEAGHVFDEIDVVLITHAHDDHTADLESIINLLNKCNNRRKGLDDFTSDDTIRADLAKRDEIDIEKVPVKDIEDAFLNGSPRRKVIDFYLTKSIIRKYTGMLNPHSSMDYQYHTLEQGNTLQLVNGLLTVRIIRASHHDLISDRDSVGFVFLFEKNVLVYTGDTGWNAEIQKMYESLSTDADLKGKEIVLLAHLGGFKRHETRYVTSKTHEGAFYKNHLGRLGLGMLIYVLHPAICFISEFGEELQHYRERVAQIYHDVFPNTLFFPADIGLVYHFDNSKMCAINRADHKNNTYRVGPTAPQMVKTCILRKDSSLHYYDGQAIEDRCDPIQILGEQFSNNMLKTEPELACKSRGCHFHNPVREKQ